MTCAVAELLGLVAGCGHLVRDHRDVAIVAAVDAARSHRNRCAEDQSAAHLVGVVEVALPGAVLGRCEQVLWDMVEQRLQHRVCWRAFGHLI